MSTTSVILDASDIGGVIFPGGSTPRITVPSNGRITVPAQDAPLYISAGARYVRSVSRAQAIVGPPRAGSAGRIVASVALSNGTLTIANQPDVPRQVLVRVDTGTAAITAGNIALNYQANDGATQIDNFSPVAPGTTLLTHTSSKGVVLVNSLIVSAMAGGASPLVQANDTNSISLQVDPDFTGFVLGQTLANGVTNGQVAVASSAASWTPSTTPNGTVTFGAVYSFTAP